MSEILIQGGVSLEGEVCVQGAKNSVLPILAATILTGGEVLLEGCPHLRDVDASVDIPVSYTHLARSSARRPPPR